MTEAAFLHTKLGCFFIGPFSRRVSFSSQQYRAIDLVDALKAKHRLDRNPDGTRKTIAVIGGGIAGLTAAVRLRQSGCSVHVFEAASELLHMQKGAHHRLIHPTIARWPGVELKYSTDFGFLDWCAGSAREVTASMLDDWMRRVGPRGRDADFATFTSAKVERVKGQGTVTLSVAAQSGDPAREKNKTVYDLAVIAVGFGQEVVPDGLTARPYWTPDDDELVGWRASDETVHVAGCGDGGIIDALRLVHGHFEGGWLAVRLAQMLDRLYAQEQLSSIEQAEDDALLTTKSIRCMGIANPMAGDAAARNDERDYDGVSEQLARFYRHLAETLPPEAAKLLDDSVVEAAVSTDKVELVAPSPTPFTPYSAPIHKIMLAHALRRRLACFRRGRLSIAGGKPELIYDDGREPISALPAGPQVVRLGASSPLRLLVGLKELESLRLRQFMLADFLDLDNARDPGPEPEETGRAAPNDKYLASKRPFVASLMQVIRPECGVGFDGSGFTYSLSGKAAPTLFPPLDIPDMLFGAPLREEKIIEVAGL